MMSYSLHGMWSPPHIKFIVYHLRKHGQFREKYGQFPKITEVHPSSSYSPAFIHHTAAQR